ncbi:hypothetical protein SAMN02799625_04543 [Methylobacterium sp. UNC300MFChir4.1]|uniref:hypothetical protein n=1 Tax=Methylobacterium sp. UNC300MFChir4.1 TaxID=1502747 RepID=UPI0008C11DBE|nr:hypothetical protein [Methylobacterium sp. UNC300MFChir4.1]SEP04882.1 hypothetical protein SAMN02799625_04543 [Methylobacterium sp. UNC300MFChir4.1]
MTHLTFDFPEAPVPAELPAGYVWDLSGCSGRGPVMTALASVEGAAGSVIPHRLRASADDIPLMNLSALRIRGRAVVIGAWEPVPDGEPCRGTPLRPDFCGAPEAIELTDFLPRVCSPA